MLCIRKKLVWSMVRYVSSVPGSQAVFNQTPPWAEGSSETRSDCLPVVCGGDNSYSTLCTQYAHNECIAEEFQHSCFLDRTSISWNLVTNVAVGVEYRRENEPPRDRVELE